VRERKSKIFRAIATKEFSFELEEEVWKYWLMQ